MRFSFRPQLGQQHENVQLIGGIDLLQDGSRQKTLVPWASEFFGYLALGWTRMNGPGL